MFERFTRVARAAVEAAAAEARDQRATTVEAEHLLLALSRDVIGGPLADVLASAGLDHAGVLAAMEAEVARSLSVVGVVARPSDVPVATGPAPEPRFGASAKLALQRALDAAAARGARRLEPVH